MNFAEKAFRQTLKRLVLIQFVLVIGLAAILFGFYEKTSEFSITLIYGGFVSIIVSILRAWRLKIATEDADTELELKLSAAKTNTDDNLESHSKTDLDATPKVTGINAAELFKGFALGYVVAIALLAFGLAGLKLEAAAVIIGFVAAQLGHFFVRPPRPGAGRR